MNNRLIERYLHLDLPRKQSAFLWGPRKTGKSTLLKCHFSKSMRYDLLDERLLIEFLTNPGRFEEQVKALSPEQRAHPIIIDEVQKVPALLDWVHKMIEDDGLSFILCGSSARKLKRSQANLLGGRAWRFELHPLVYAELTSPDLLTILNRGLIPSHYLSTHFRRMLRGYTIDYLKEEVINEALVRDIPSFSRFFEAVAFSNGELINYSKIATDAGVASRTIKGYFEILVDTLLGSFILPFQKRIGRDIISKAPKFYLFDVGVAGSLLSREIGKPRGAEFGKAFEHYIYQELRSYASYSELHYPIQFWRTKSGLEVDFVLSRGEIAIEVKGASTIRSADLRSMKAFNKDYQPRRSIIVSNEASPRKVGQIEILPWRIFLEKLWGGGILG